MKLRNPNGRLDVMDCGGRYREKIIQRDRRIFSAAVENVCRNNAGHFRLFTNRYASKLLVYHPP